MPETELPFDVETVELSEEADVPIDVEPKPPPPQDHFLRTENRETHDPIQGCSASDNGNAERSTTMANIDLDDLIGRSYLTTPNEDGT